MIENTQYSVVVTWNLYDYDKTVEPTKAITTGRGSQRQRGSAAAAAAAHGYGQRADDADDQFPLGLVS